MSRIDTLINEFNLKRHPEGGYFTETYRAEEFCHPQSASGAPRRIATTIYYLLTRDTQSSLHRLKSDEVWHFYMGGPMELHFFHEDRGYQKHVLGTAVEKGERPQLVVPAHTWFGGFPSEGVEYTLVGCTVFPGFEFEDFEFADRRELLTGFPEHTEVITRLTQLDANQ